MTTIRPTLPPPAPGAAPSSAASARAAFFDRREMESQTSHDAPIVVRQAIENDEEISVLARARRASDYCRMDH